MAGLLVTHLSRAMLDGYRDLRTVPTLVIRLVREHLWQTWADPESGRRYPPNGEFASFAQFVVTPVQHGGLGSSIKQLRGLCGEVPEALDLLDRALQNPPHKHADVNNMNVTPSRPRGTSKEQALRKLRAVQKGTNNVSTKSRTTRHGQRRDYALERLEREAPALHAEVVAQKLSAHAAMVQAGYRPRTLTVNLARPEATARSLLRNMPAGDVALLVKALLDADDVAAAILNWPET